MAADILLYQTDLVAGRRGSEAASGTGPRYRSGQRAVWRYFQNGTVYSKIRRACDVVCWSRREENVKDDGSGNVIVLLEDRNRW